MSSPLISVIMPAYNAGKYISESIKSVIKQTFDNWELIVIDDGSTDDTASVVKGMAASDNRIRYIHQENGRQGKARNNGIKNSRGEYIAFLDADDLWMPQKLQKQIESIHTGNADLVFSGFSTFVTGSHQFKEQGVYPGYYKGEEGLKIFLGSNYIPILTVLVKKNALEDVNLFSENPDIQNAEDYHIWLKLLAAGYVIWGSPEILAHYRLHAASSSAIDRQVIFQSLNSMKELAKEYPATEKSVKEVLVRRIDKHIRQNNISDWQFIKRLLDIRATLTKSPKSFFPGKSLHQLLGKRIFRIAYTYFYPAKDDFSADINLNELSF